MLRPFVVPNLCTQCHGQEARARFLSFHGEDRGTTRPGPAESGP